MCKSLPISAMQFDLYSACPFESLPVVPAAGPAVTAPEPEVPGGVQTSVCLSSVFSPARSTVEFRYGFGDSDGCSIDAPDWLPHGGHLSRLHAFGGFHFYAFDGLGVRRRD